MKINNINPSAAIGSYLNTSSASKTTASGKKTDTVAIDGRSFNPKAYSATVAKEVSADISPERLDALKKAVEDGSYNIPAELLADALLGKI